MIDPPETQAGLVRSAAAEEEFRKLDRLELGMLTQAPAVDLPLVHRFTPGLYVREIFMPAGTLCTSKIHKTEHPFVITKGRVSVYIPGVGVEHFQAPHFGITKPGTRRVLYIHEDCTWITFHPNPTDDEDLTVMEERLIERRELPSGQTAYELYQTALSSGMLAPEEAEPLYRALTGGAA